MFDLDYFGTYINIIHYIGNFRNVNVKTRTSAKNTSQDIKLDGALRFVNFFQ